MEKTNFAHDEALLTRQGDNDPPPMQAIHAARNVFQKESERRVKLETALLEEGNDKGQIMMAADDGEALYEAKDSAFSKLPERPNPKSAPTLGGAFAAAFEHVMTEAVVDERVEEEYRSWNMLEREQRAARIDAFEREKEQKKRQDLGIEDETNLLDLNRDFRPEFIKSAANAIRGFKAAAGKADVAPDPYDDSVFGVCNLAMYTCRENLRITKTVLEYVMGYSANIQVGDINMLETARLEHPKKQQQTLKKIVLAYATECDRELPAATKTVLKNLVRRLAQDFHDVDHEGEADLQHYLERPVESCGHFRQANRDMWMRHMFPDADWPRQDPPNRGNIKEQTASAFKIGETVQKNRLGVKNDPNAAPKPLPGTAEARKLQSQQVVDPTFAGALPAGATINKTTPGGRFGLPLPGPQTLGAGEMAGEGINHGMSDAQLSWKRMEHVTERTKDDIAAQANALAAKDKPRSMLGLPAGAFGAGGGPAEHGVLPGVGQGIATYAQNMPAQYNPQMLAAGGMGPGGAGPGGAGPGGMGGAAPSVDPNDPNFDPQLLQQQMMQGAHPGGIGKAFLGNYGTLNRISGAPGHGSTLDPYGGYGTDPNAPAGTGDPLGVQGGRPESSQYSHYSSGQQSQGGYY